MDAKSIIKRFYDLAKEVLADDEVGCDQISIVFGNELNAKDKLTVDIRNADKNYHLDDENEKSKDISLEYYNEYWSINTFTKWMSYADFEDDKKLDKWIRIGIIEHLN